MAIKVDVPLDLDYLGYLKMARLQGIHKRFLVKPHEYNSNKEELHVKNDIVKENLKAFYDKMLNYCRITKTTLDCTYLDKAINSFESFLKNETGQTYKIRLIADGNI